LEVWLAVSDALELTGDPLDKLVVLKGLACPFVILQLQSYESDLNVNRVAWRKTVENDRNS